MPSVMEKMFSKFVPVPLVIYWSDRSHFFANQTHPFSFHFAICRAFWTTLFGAKLSTKKTHICFENTPRRIPASCIPELLLQQALSSQWDVPMHIFWPNDLDLWPMTLTYELDLDILPLELHAKIQVCMSVRSARIVRRTDTHTHTDRQTMSKLLLPSRQRRGV